jgi:hypothetical protein
MEFSALSWTVAIRVRPSASRAMSTPSPRWKKNALTGLGIERFSHAVVLPTIRRRNPGSDEATGVRRAEEREMSTLHQEYGRGCGRWFDRSELVEGGLPECRSSPAPTWGSASGSVQPTPAYDAVMTVMCDGLLVESAGGVGECDQGDACQALAFREDYEAYRAAHGRVITGAQAENEDEYGGEA